MKLTYVFSLLLITMLLTACGPSAEEKRQVEMEQQRIEQEVSERLAKEKANRTAAVTCSILGETRNMDAAIRVEKMNDAREKIGGEPFLRGDDAIQEAFEWGLCQELVLNDSYDEILEPLKDAKRERERIARERERIARESRIADSKPTVEEELYPNGKLKSRTNRHPKNDGEEKHGLAEDYYENGNLKRKVNYKDGQRDGREELYFENGKLERTANFISSSAMPLDELPLLPPRDCDRYSVFCWDGKVDGLMEYFDKRGLSQGKTCYKYGEETDMSYCEK